MPPAESSPRSDSGELTPPLATRPGAQAADDSRKRPAIRNELFASRLATAAQRGRTAPAAREGNADLPAAPLLRLRLFPSRSAFSARRRTSAVFGPVLTPPCIRQRVERRPSGRLKTGAWQARPSRHFAPQPRRRAFGSAVWRRGGLRAALITRFMPGRSSAYRPSNATHLCGRSGSAIRPGGGSWMRELGFKLTLAHDEFNARILEVADEEQVATVAEIDPALRFGPTPADRGETQEGAARSEARGDLAGSATQGLEGSPEMTLTAPSPDDIRRQQDTAERADVEEVSRNEARDRIDTKREAADQVGVIQPSPFGVDPSNTTDTLLGGSAAGDLCGQRARARLGAAPSVADPRASRRAFAVEESRRLRTIDGAFRA